MSAADPSLSSSKRLNYDKITSQLRITQIEKNIRSISSILDNRKLYEFEEVPSDLRRERERADRKHKTRRENVTQNSVIDAVAFLKEQGIKMNQVIDEFSDEEILWRNKSKSATYTQKRKFEDPELHRFYLSLNEDQIKEFSIMCKEALYRLCQTLRESMRNSKDVMDNKAIFHPQVNAHRVHCAYLMKLYKQIDASVIEDPVLRDLQRRDISWVGQTNYSKSITPPLREAIDRPTTSSINKARGPILKECQSAEKINSEVRLLEKLMPSKIDRTAVKDLNSKNSDSPTASTRIDRLCIDTLGDSKIVLTKSSDISGLNTKVPSTITKYVPPLDEFMEAKNSQWLVDNVQHDQLDALAASSILPSWKHISGIDKAVSLPCTPLGERNDPPSPPKLLSFSDFQKLFEQYTSTIPCKPPTIDVSKQQQQVSNTTKTADSEKRVNVIKCKQQYSGRTEHNDVVIDTLMEKLEPQLDAFVNLKLKKPTTLQMVSKMFDSSKKNDRLHAGKEFQKKTKVGCVGLKALNRVKSRPGTTDSIIRNDSGFRNIFLDPELSASDEELTTSVVSEESNKNESSRTETDESPGELKNFNEIDAIQWRKHHSKRSDRIFNPIRHKSTKIENSVIHQLQLDIWECLKLGTSTRISLMQKYSSVEFAPFFLSATVLWRDIASALAFRSYLRNIIIEQRVDTSTAMSLRISLLSGFECTLPDSFKTPLPMMDDEIPLKSIGRMLTRLLKECDESIHQYLPTVIRELDIYLASLLDKAETIYQDVVQFGNMTCKEYIHTKKFPPLRLH